MIGTEESRRGDEWKKERQERKEERRNENPKALEYRAQLQNGISLGSVSSTLIGLTLLIPPDVQH